MPPAPRPSAVDAKLLATLERAFERLAGADARIDVQELKTALGLRSEYLARRVLASFDTNGDGLIEKGEFIEGVRKLVAGTPREKLAFVFRLYDHDGDGAISAEELHRMIAISLSEADVIERPTQPAHRLAQALLSAADTNRDGRISFDELEAVMRRHPELLEKMTRSEAAWIAPNEDVLAWLDGETRKSSVLAPILENGWVPTLVIVLWIGVNLGILGFGLMRHRTAAPMNELMQAGRALGRCINFNGALLLVPVMRRLLTWVRSTFVGRVLPVDQAITFHRVVGHTLAALGVAHGGALVASYAIGHPAGSMAKWLFSTERGLTGIALVAIVAVMWVFALSVVRRSRHFELFYFSHLLYLAWFPLAVLHAPSFLFWAGVPVLGFAVEQLLRVARRGTKADVVSAQALRSGVTRLELLPPPGFTYRAGDYVFLRIPAIAKREWHPFTLSSAPERSTLTVHVRSLGNWTAALRRRVEHDESTPGAQPLVAYVDGPYGSPSAHIFDSRFAVFIGAGIGVTPFASVLESLVLRANGSAPPKLKKAYFFWLNKDQYSFEWFAALLGELEKIDKKEMLQIHLCMTAGRAGATALALEAARGVMHAQGRSDIITGLRTQTHMGHPDWDKMLGTIKAFHEGSTVDVYFCGPAGLGAKIRRVCVRLGMPFREERF